MKRAEALGEEPAHHDTKKLYLSGVTDKDVKSAILKVYADLLRRCLKRWTQNPNESKLWRVCQKHKFCNTGRVTFAAGAVVSRHNFGHHDGSLLARMGLLSENVVQRLKKDTKDAVLATPKPSLKRKRVADEPSTSYGAGLF